MKLSIIKNYKNIFRHASYAVSVYQSWAAKIFNVGSNVVLNAGSSHDKFCNNWVYFVAHNLDGYIK
jgi:hypothetical protein